MNINGKVRKVYRVKAHQPRRLTLLASNISQVLRWCRKRDIEVRKVVQVKLVDRFPALHGQTD